MTEIPVIVLVKERMVLPLSGPFYDTVTELGPSVNGGPSRIWKSDYKEWTRQRKPYNLPLPYIRSIREATSLSANFPGVSLDLDQVWCCDTHTSAPVNKLLDRLAKASFNKAYKDWVEALKPAQAELLAALAERASSMEMIAKRARQLASAASQLRSGNAGAALITLGFNSGDSKKLPRPGKKQFADTWLEYKFGWAPLAQDIRNAIKALNEPFPGFRVVGRGTVKGDFKDHVVAPGISVYDVFCDVKSSHKIFARLRATNPNIALANSLGLLNPAFAAWEVIPYSFVVDYFVNVGEWLNGFTDQYGLELTDTSWNWLCRANSKESLEFGTPPLPPSGGKAEWEGRRFELHRDTGTIPRPFLIVRPPWRVSPSRASTSIALLLQQLHRAGR